MYCNNSHRLLTALQLCLLLVVFPVLAVGTADLRAGESAFDLFVQTKVIEGLSIGVTDQAGFTNTAIDKRLYWTVFNAGTNFVPTRLPILPGDAYQIDMFDAEGNAVPKSELGKKVGTKFLDFEASSLKQDAQTQLVYPRNRKDHFLQFYLFRPSDLFMVEKPGTYTLRMRFQLFIFAGTPGHLTPRLIRFPPLDCRLVKSESAR